MDELAQRGVLDDTLLIVLSDHGEHFGEHDLMLHGGSLYTQEIHVPLLVRFPQVAQPGASVAAAVSLRDLAATVCDLIGLAEGAPFPGRSLRPTWTEPGRSAEEPVISEADQVQHLSAHYPAARGRLASLVRDSLHFIWHAADGHEELYDLDSDPGETNDLAGQADASILAELRGALRAALSA